GAQELVNVRAEAVNDDAGRNAQRQDRRGGRRNAAPNALAAAAGGCLLHDRPPCCCAVGLFPDASFPISPRVRTRNGLFFWNVPYFFCLARLAASLAWYLASSSAKFR